MQDMTLLWTLGSTSLATAVVGGVFLTFSDFAMRSFTVASEDAGTEAMQVLNRVIYRSIFMVMLLGLAPIMIGVAALAWPAAPGPVLQSILIGTGLYLLGVMIVTIAGNVPRNKRLDALPLDGAAQAYWKIYRVEWTRLNHIRTIASVGSAAFFGLATIQLALTM